MTLLLAFSVLSVVVVLGTISSGHIVMVWGCTDYALGRAVQLSDRKLVDELTKTMVDGGRWSDVLLIIVRSEQLRCIRPVAATVSTRQGVR